MKAVVLAAVSVALVLAVGCGRKKGSAARDAAVRAFSGGSVEMDSDGEGARIRTPDGTVTVAGPRGGKLPPGFPANVPQYPGSSVVHSVVAEDAMGVTLQSPDSLQAITDYYKREMKANGWKEEGAIAMGESAMLAYSMGGTTVNIVISDTGDARMITLGIAPSGDTTK